MEKALKRTLSLILTACMLMSSVYVFPLESEATAVLEDNVAAEAYYFDGDVVYFENSGTGSQYGLEDPVDVKSGNSAHTLNIDGEIEEGEWGDVAVHVDAAYAANNIAATGAWLNNAMNDAVFQHPSAENTYFYGNNKTGDSTFNNSTNKNFYSYDLYFMWDEDFLYLGARVYDPYNHQNVNSGADCWDGDALQFIVDPQGPNSRAVAEGKPYSQVLVDGIKTMYHDDGTTYLVYENNPWNGAVVGAGGVMYTPISNFIAAWSTANSGYTELWDAALRYYPYEEEFNDTDPETGDIFVNTRTKWQTAGIQYDYQDDFWADQDIAAYATVHPTNYGSVKEPNYQTDYEIAIPWEMVTLANNDGTFQDTMVAEIGTELGISVAVLNASKPGNGTYDSWLSWGSGVCGSQTMYDYQTAGGSNLLTLSGTNYKSHVACDHTFAAATCIAPETCTKCGYQRGFETGHNYVCTDEVLPTASKDGSVKATCSVCGEVKNLVLGANNPERKFGSSETDSAIHEKMGPSGWKANWYDEIDDGSTPDVREGNMLYYRDAQGNLKSKTSFDNWTFPGSSVIDIATRGDGLYYVDGTPVTFRGEHTSADGASTIKEMDWSSQAGTYFDAESIGKSYTFKADIMVTDLKYSLDQGHAKGFYIWYGKSVVDYMAGLFIIGPQNDPTYIFAIANTSMCDPVTDNVELFEQNAIAYVEVPESVVAEDEWHQFVVMYDDNAQYASVYWDGEQMVSAHEPLFKYTIDTAYTLFRRINVPMYLKNIDYASTAYTANYIQGASETYTAPIDGVEYQYEAGATVEITAANGAFYRDADDKAMRFGAWTGDVEFADANAAATTFTMPAADVTIDSTYYLIGDLNGDGKVNVTDANLIKKMITGAAELLPAADINLDNKVNAQDANNLKAMVLGKFTPER